MYLIIYTILFGLAIGSGVPRSNSCLDNHLKHGWSFPDTIINCQFKVTSLMQFVPSTNLPSSQRQASTLKALPNPIPSPVPGLH